MVDQENEWTHLGVAAALAENYRRDAQSFLPLLAVALSTSLPSHTNVERKGGLFQRTKPVHKVTVTFEDDIYSIENQAGAGLQAHRIKIVRNIVLKRDRLKVEEWLHELCGEIAMRAEQNEKTFFALKNMLE